MPLDDRDVPVGVLVEGALTYTYVGQAELVRERPPSSGPQPYQLGGEGTSALQDLYDTIRIDDLGREWRVTDVDVDLACELAGLSADKCDLEAVSKPEPFEEGLWWPQSWTFPGGTFPFEGVDVEWKGARWSDESRTMVGSNFTEREKKTVSIHYAPNGDFANTTVDFLCSGSVIGPRTVLTAAHCIAPTWLSSTLPAAGLRVCTRGNLYHDVNESICTSVSASFVNVNWTTLGQKRWDLAVLRVHDNLEMRVGYMILSQDSATDIQDANLRHNGFPVAVPESNYQNFWAHGATDQAVNGLRMWKQGGSPIEVSTHFVRTQMDTTSGQSGGPIFKCHGPTCETGEPAFQVSLMSGYYLPIGEPIWTGGPLIPARHVWISDKVQ